MFQAFGDLISRRWPIFLAAWAVIVGLAYWVAPPWDDIVMDREFAFLPADMTSRRGEELFKTAFPDQFHPSSIGIVFERTGGVLTAADKKLIAREVEPELVHIAAKHRSIIDSVRTMTDPEVGPLLVSEDQHATLAVLELTSELLEHRNWLVMDDIDAMLGKLRVDQKVPAGLEISLTGSGAVGADITRAHATSARTTEFWTVLLVVVLLLLIYRAPLLALVPLITVFLAVNVALNFLSLLAKAEIIGLFQGVQTFLTVIIYGTGVDYCLFLISRYREELAKVPDTGPEGEDARYRDAIAKALGKVGAAVTASAATVTLAIGMMTFARFGQFHEAGIAISASLFLGLCAVLTLTPALLRLAGRWAFWPKKDWQLPGRKADGPQDTATETHSIWDRLATLLRNRPGAIWLGTITLMTPLAVLAYFNLDNLEIDMLKRLHSNAPSIVGTEALQRHFPAGITGPVVVLVRSTEVDFRSDAGEDLIDALTNRLIEQKKELGLADIRSLTKPLGITSQAQEAMNQIALRRQQQQSAKNKPVKDMHRAAQDFYVSGADVTQVQLVLTQNPLGRASIKLLDKLEEAMKSALPPELKQAEILYLGQTSSIRDLNTLMSQDQMRIEILVIGAVFLILIVLLRRPVVSLYLIVSVLLSFYTTLGATVAVFWALDPPGFTGLDWKVPIFLFTILVAVGEDYNIFLMTRIHEEQETHGPVEGVTQALIKTGRIITSCGIIMAGAFATLMTGSLMDLKELGFALAFGVLLDTFVVRPILVPTFMILLHKSRGEANPPGPQLARPSIHRALEESKR
jgi:putative drug exporter of the RND superfamily